MKVGNLKTTNGESEVPRFNLVKESRPIYKIEGDYKVWRYLTLHGALNRLAIRKLSKKYPVSYEPPEYETGYPGSYESEISYDQRCAIVKRFARRWKRHVQRAEKGGGR